MLHRSILWAKIAQIAIVISLAFVSLVRAPIPVQAAPNGATPPPDEGPGGPILVIASAEDPFGRYYGEILRVEGLNAFIVTDITRVTASLLSNHDVVILGQCLSQAIR